MQKNTARNCHGSGAGIEIDLVIAWMVQIDLISVVWIGIDLAFVCGSKMTWCRAWIEINLIFVSEGIEINLFLEL